MITGMPRIAIAMHDFDACVDRFRDDRESVTVCGAHIFFERTS